MNIFFWELLPLVLENFPNFILQSLVSALRYENEDINWLINLLTTFKQEYVFMNRTVKEILWGYQDPALHFAKAYDPEWFYTDIAGYFINVSMSSTHAYDT